MHLILTMAGKGSRFSKVGYTTPKFLLKIGDDIVLNKVLLSFDLEQFESITFICLQEHLHTFKLHEIIYKLTLPHPNINIVSIDKVTNGQAETASIFLKKNFLENIVIFNVDSFYSEKILLDNMFIDNFAGSIQVFNSICGDQYSFVLPSSKSAGLNNIIAIEEKVKISNYASTGLYLFKNSEVFCKGFEGVLKKVKLGFFSETFVSLIYKELLEMGYKISGFETNASTFHVVGTPNEYKKYCNKIEDTS